MRAFMVPSAKPAYSLFKRLFVESPTQMGGFAPCEKGIHILGLCWSFVGLRMPNLLRAWIFPCLSFKKLS